METLGEKEGGGKCSFVEAKSRGAVFEGTVLCAVVAIPAASSETAGIITDKA